MALVVPAHQNLSNFRWTAMMRLPDPATFAEKLSVTVHIE